MTHMATAEINFEVRIKWDAGIVVLSGSLHHDRIPFSQLKSKIAFYERTDRKYGLPNSRKCADALRFAVRLIGERRLGASP